MQPELTTIANEKAPDTPHEEHAPTKLEIAATAPGQYRVIRRNGKVTTFDREKIKVAVTKAFLAVEGGHAAASTRIHEMVNGITDTVFYALSRSRPQGGTFHIEDIQDQVELALMRSEHHKIARAYVLYREERHKEREQIELTTQATQQESDTPELHVKDEAGNLKALDVERLARMIEEACADTADVTAQPIIEETLRNLYDGIPEHEVGMAVTMSARTLIEQEPNYTYVTARLLLDNLRRESLSFVYGVASEATFKEMSYQYADYFENYIHKAISLELLDPKLASDYDLKKLAKALQPQRDHQFTYLGMQTLYCCCPLLTS